MAVMGADEDDLAAATKATGELLELPEVGEQTVMPAVVAVQGPGGLLVPLPTVIVRGVLKTAPVESQAWTTMLWFPDASDRLVFSDAAELR